VETAWKWPGATPGISVISNRATVVTWILKTQGMVFAAGTYEECCSIVPTLFSWPPESTFLSPGSPLYQPLQSLSHFPAVTTLLHSWLLQLSTTQSPMPLHTLPIIVTQLSPNVPTPLREPQCITCYLLPNFNQSTIPQPTPSKSSSAFHHCVLTFFYLSHSHFYVTIFSQSCFFFISFMIFLFLPSLLLRHSISQPSFICLLWYVHSLCINSPVVDTEKAINFPFISESVTSLSLFLVSASLSLSLCLLSQLLFLHPCHYVYHCTLTIFIVIRSRSLHHHSAPRRISAPRYLRLLSLSLSHPLSCHQLCTLFRYSPPSCLSSTTLAAISHYRTTRATQHLLPLSTSVPHSGSLVAIHHLPDLDLDSSICLDY